MTRTSYFINTNIFPLELPRKRGCVVRKQVAGVPAVAARLQIAQLLSKTTQNSGLAWFLYKCKGLWSTICGPPATERTLGAICKGKGISSRFQVSISSQYDLSCWKQCKTQSLSSFLLPSKRGWLGGKRVAGVPAGVAWRLLIQLLMTQLLSAWSYIPCTCTYTGLNNKPGTFWWRWSERCNCRSQWAPTTS